MTLSHKLLHRTFLASLAVFSGLNVNVLFGGPHFFSGPVPLSASVAAVMILALPSDAEARRFGGGRSLGFRGSRGLFRRSGSSFRPGGGRSFYGRGSGYRRSYYGGFGVPFFGFGMGYGMFGLGRLFLFPLILFFVLRMMSGRRR